MKKNQLTIVLFLLSWYALPFLSAQNVPACTSLTEFAADDCGSACAGCQLEGYNGTTVGFTSGGGVFCNGALVENNSVWHAFIAGSTAISLQVESYGCTQGDGLQIAIFDQCGGEALACNAGSAGGGGNVHQITYSSFVPGNAYYLLVNGYDGDECNYTASVTLGVCFEPILGTIGPVTGLGVVCPGATTQYSIPPVSNALWYEWTAPNGASINGSGLNQLTLPAPDGQSVSITFQTQFAGNAQVRVRALGACGKTTNTVIRPVTMAPLPPTILPTLFLLPDDLPFQWALDPSFNIFTPGTYQAMTVLTSFLGCDSLVRQTIIVSTQTVGTVFWDFNNNNQYNSALELPAEGVTILASDGQVVQTDADGQFEFQPLAPGSTISIGGLPNFTNSVQPNSHIVQGSVGNYLFALKPQKGAASGYVFIDNNQNGQFDAGDTPIPGGAITTTSGLQTVVNANGFYQLNNVAYPEQFFISNLPPELEIVSQPGIYIPNITQNYHFIVQYKSAYGTVYWDVDLDNTLGAADVPAPGINLTNSGALAGLSNINGQYNLNNAQVGDTIRAVFPGATVQPAFYIIQANTPAGGYPFLLIAQNLTRDVSVDVTNNTVFRPGFSTVVTVTVRNPFHTVLPDVSVGLRFPGILEKQNLSATPVFDGTDSIHWQIGPMTPFQTKVFTVKLRTPINTALGTALLFRATAYPLLGDDQPANNRDQFTAFVVGAYDPNDKQVSPAWATPEMLDANTALRYTIRFQNTGNYPAEWVELIDTLSADLDWSSFRQLAASHACEWQISPEGILKIQFPNIHLPDSISDEPGSHGFFKFAILPHPGLGVGDALPNFCDIYFDFNPPIRTNTAWMQVVYFLPGEMPANTGNLLSARPNPASFGIYFSWPELSDEEGFLTLYNVMGAPVLTVPIAAGVNEAYLATGFVPDGLYLAVLEAGNLYYYKRVVIAKEGPVRKRQ